MDDTQLSIIKQVKSKIIYTLQTTTTYEYSFTCMQTIYFAHIFIIIDIWNTMNIFGYMTTINTIKTTKNFKYFRSRLAVWGMVWTVMSDFEIGELHDFMIFSYFQDF